MMQILDLLGMYFDAAVVFVTNSLLLFRLAMAILCTTLLSFTAKLRAQSKGDDIHSMQLNMPF